MPSVWIRIRDVCVDSCNPFTKDIYFHHDHLYNREMVWHQSGCMEFRNNKILIYFDILPALYTQSISKKMSIKRYNTGKGIHVS